MESAQAFASLVGIIYFNVKSLAAGTYKSIIQPVQQHIQRGGGKTDLLVKDCTRNSQVRVVKHSYGKKGVTFFQAVSLFCCFVVGASSGICWANP